jgi:hypothetical protein
MDFQLKMRLDLLLGVTNPARGFLICLSVIHKVIGERIMWRLCLPIRPSVSDLISTSESLHRCSESYNI